MIAITISNHQIKEELFASQNTLVYRAIREADQKSVIIKAIRETNPAPEKVAWFKREYQLIHGLNLEGVVKAYDLEFDVGYWLMVLEDFGGQAISSLVGQLSVADFLKIALKVTEVLDQLHQQGVTHKDINPSNILYNPSTGQIKWIDFGIASNLAHETVTFRNPNALDGTLAYMSPEQTGRMNRAVDYRTDFYSLGVTFYELLTGQLPFKGDNPLALIQQHLTETPAAPHTLKADIPPIISDIIMKLMAKNAEDRYKSAYGLKRDLEKCLISTESSFELSQEDVSNLFQIPQKLYGRENESSTLLAGFERVSQGTSEMMLVAGYSGIGKSSLVQEIYKPITRQKGYFITGKFDQFQRNIPYSAFIQAFRSLMQQLLGEDESHLSRWRERLTEAVGATGQVIIDVIPELEQIIGAQPPVLELGPVESQNRFNLTFETFLRVFTQPEHPLVIFVDDLQWSDGASLKLLELLMTAVDMNYLYFIGAYRDNEVNDGHPFMWLLTDLKNANTTINTITLSPLGLGHVTQLVADTLNQPSTNVETLATLVHKKTGGNPFFMLEFLKFLHAENLITFNYDERQWQWDIAQIQAREVTEIHLATSSDLATTPQAQTGKALEEVVELMAGKLQLLNEATQQELKLAACIGSQFDLKTLAVVSQQPAAVVATNLWTAVAAGLILPLSDVYKLIALDVAGLAETLNPSYKFTHDRIQQAAYSLIPPADKEAVHWRIGQLLLSSVSSAEQAERIFDIVNQLNKGRKLADTPAQQEELAQLNMLAGKRAKEASAYQPAVEYFGLSIELFGRDNWQTRYSELLELHLQLGEAEFLNKNFERSGQVLDVALAQAQSKADKAKAYIVKLAQLSVMGLYHEAVDEAIKALNMYGLNIPQLHTEPEAFHQATMAELALYQENMKTRQIEDLWNLPVMTDKDLIVVCELLSIVHDSVTIAMPQHLAYFSTKMVNLSIESGLSEHSPTGYVFFSGVQTAAFKAFKEANVFAKLGIRLLEEKGFNQVVKAKVYHIGSYFLLLSEHISIPVEYQRKGYRAGVEMGDIIYAGYAFSGATRLLLPSSLAEGVMEILRCLTFFSQTDNPAMLHFTQLVLGFAGTMQGKTEGRGSLNFGDFTEQGYRDMFEVAAPILGAYYKRYKMQALAIYERYEEALPFVKERAVWIGGVGTLDLLFRGDYYMYSGITVSNLYPQASADEQQEYLTILDEAISETKILADLCPLNYRHGEFILRAEKAKVENRPTEAIEFYLQAIDVAAKNDFKLNLALAHEFVAKLYLADNDTETAQQHLSQAVTAYQTWGANDRAAYLVEKYPQFLTA